MADAERRCSCGHRISSPDAKRCPSCNRKLVEKVVAGGAAAVVGGAVAYKGAKAAAKHLADKNPQKVAQAGKGFWAVIRKLV
jgi:hypothetical protein